MNTMTTGTTSEIESNYRYTLEAIFAPRQVAVIGATDRPQTVGRAIMVNLTNNAFGRQIYPVNPKHETVLGLKAYPNIAAVPEKVDLALIATPAATVPGIVKECVAAGVKGAIIISAGFRELGPAGAELEDQILAVARRGNMRIIGPNCLGVINPYSSLNATFAGAMPIPGSVGFISQSGAFGTAVLDWSLRDMVGFSAFVSIGSMLDVNWGDLITYLGRDPHTKSIVIYMETVGDARSFMSAAREVAFTRPIIVLKAGHTQAAAKAAASHTGALTGSDAVLDVAFHRSGVLRVEQISHLFYMAEVLSKQPRPKGPRLTILTNAGGPGVLATDALITSGGELAELSPETFKALNDLLPEHWSRGNPIDILGDADPERYAQTLDIAISDPNSDGLLVILTPQNMADPTQTAEQLRERLKICRKPVLASWMGGAEVAGGEAILNRTNIPTFDYPDTAARIFNYMWQYSKNLRSLYETPSLPSNSDESAPDRARVTEIIAAAHQAGRTLLTELESKQLLDAYGIPTVETHLATSEAEAVKRANEIGYPVVLKLHSETITHKSDVGGVHLNLADAEAVGEAYQAIKRGLAETDFLGVTVQPMIKADGYELILGSNIDPQFGPVLLFGLGGQLVEVFKDRALGLPPLTSTLARRMMEQTRIYKALQGVRGRQPVDLEALEQLMVRFSQLAVEQRWIKELDINPFLASANQLLALDARVLLQPPEVQEEELPKPAIRPYPIQYMTDWQLKDGTPVTIRPIRAEDETMMVNFHHTLSEDSVYYRFFQMMPLERRIEHERLSRICFIDYNREIALVVNRRNPETGEQEILGVGRLIKLADPDQAEFAVLVSDGWQGQGIGSKLLELLVEVGRQEKIKCIIGTVLPENYGMLALCKKLGFEIHRSFEDRVVEAKMNL